MNRLKNSKFAALYLGFILGSAWVFAQTCIIPAPAAPPTPTQATVTLPIDGGTVGCTFTAFVPNSVHTQTAYTVSSAKCATMVAMARQAAATDNGWGDGGVP